MPISTPIRPFTRSPARAGGALLPLLMVCLLAGACDDGAGTAAAPPDAAALDMQPTEGRLDAMLDGFDGMPDDSDAMPDDSDAMSDAMPDGSDAMPDGPDAMTPPAPRCSMPPAEPMQPDGPLPPAASPHRGVDALEVEAWDRLRDGLLADPGVHFVATYDHGRDAYVIDGGPVDARARLVVRRVDGATRSTLEVVEGAVADVFPSVEPDLYGDYAALLAAMENPEGVVIPDRGYADDDPRVGWLPLEAQSWPDPLVRLTTAFDAPDAPDGMVGVWPWAGGGTGRHGGLGLLQSQSIFVVSGAGARQGVVIDGAARLVDAAPTALAALGIPTTGGVGPDGTYPDGLYLARQDGVVRWEALDPDPCVRPRYVVMILFDGLQAIEANHLMLADAPPIELPALRRFAAEGAVYRHGAVVGFPSYSAPGHTTAGTGVWPGHHGVVSNGFFGRAEQATINPFAVLSDLPAFFAEPQRLYDLYDRMLADDAETISQAMHRALDGETFTAVLNELTIGGADYTPLHHFGIAHRKAAVGDSERIDALGQLMVQRLLGDPQLPVPEVLQLSMLATDAAGENDGPHSDLLRQTLANIDRRLTIIREAYAQRGVLDQTMFILVSDHGMELTDPTRRAGLNGAIGGTGVRTRYVGNGGIWLATLALALERTGDGLEVTVTAHDDGRPVEGATVRCEGCGGLLGEDEGVTDADGRVVIPLGVLAEPTAVSASHPRYNEQTAAP